MKTIGLLGGMSWQSTELYYRWINTGVKERLGGLHSAHIVLESLDFEQVAACQRSSDWAAAGELLAASARRLEAAGADLLLICSNTMHRVAPEVEAAVAIPLLHLADATGTRIKAAGLGTIGLLGTAFTMEGEFYKERLSNRHNLTVIVPSAEERRLVHRVIYEELCLGVVREASRRAYLRVIESLRRQGAQGVILGCTEITMLIKQAHTDLALFDTTAIHAEEAVDMALASTPATSVQPE